MRRISKLRFEFEQHIFRLLDMRHMVKAKILGAPINTEGRPKLTPELELLVERLLTPLES